MNREIKFRAWDKKFNRMIKKIGVLKDGRANASNLYVGRQRTEPSDCVLMQYTGLKDKNGVEIYEGDIVSARKLKKNYCENIEEFGVDEERKGVVFYSTCHYAIAWNEYCFNDMTDFISDQENVCLEVVGNIYEVNDEL